MPLDILTFGEALVEIMRTDIDQPLDHPGPFEGPYPSGAPFIFTVQAARLGAKAACIGCVGDDAFGRCLIDQLRADGVETRAVHTLPGYTTGAAFIAYRGDGSRDFVFHMRHAAAGQLNPELADPTLLEGLRVLHISGSSLAMHTEAQALGARLLALAKAQKTKISFDPNIRAQLMAVDNLRTLYHPFIEAADILLTTSEEMLLLTEAQSIDEAVGLFMGADLHKIIVVHEGKAGSTVYTAHGSEHIPAFAVEEIDPTGAGDCFDAGFLARWLEGTTPIEAARFANACGALAVTARGPMTGAKHRAQVESFLHERT